MQTFPLTHTTQENCRFRKEIYMQSQIKLQFYLIVF